MKNSEKKTRRDVLKLMGAAAGGTLLAACDTTLVSDTPSVATAGAGGRTFYVAKNGSDQADGMDKNSPLASLAGALAKRLVAGDTVLFKNGDQWNSNFDISNLRGTEERPITISTYGDGSRAKLTSDRDDYVCKLKDNQHFFLKGFHIPAKKAGQSAIRNSGSQCQYTAIENILCTTNKAWGTRSGIYYGAGDDPIQYVIIRNCELVGFAEALIGQSGSLDGGLIEGNLVRNCPETKFADGIRAIRADWHGLTIRNNEVKEFGDDGIDLYNAKNVIVEYNHVHSSRAKSGAGNGIKAGGVTGNSSTGTTSYDNVVRYNCVHDLRSGGGAAGVDTNGGNRTQIYGNLIYGCDGAGIVLGRNVTNEGREAVVHNNTTFDVKEGLFCNVNSGTHRVRNNCLSARGRSLVSNGNSQIRGSNNFVPDGTSGNYTSSNDIKGDSPGFVNSGGEDFRLEASSPLVNAGVAVAGYTEDIRGAEISGKVDIGCYEYASGDTDEDESDLGPITLFLAGGSTTFNDDRQFAGWGQKIGEFFSGKVTINNQAVQGIDSGRFLSGPRWDAIIDNVSPGDYVFLAFGHNEFKNGQLVGPGPGYNGTFKNTIKAMDSQVKKEGAGAVNLSPPSRHQVSRNGGGDYFLKNLLSGEHANDPAEGNYLKASEKAAAEMNAVFLDLNARSRILYVDNWSQKGPTQEDVRRYFPAYETVSDSDYRTAYGGAADSTHLGDEGAREIAKIIVSLIINSDDSRMQTLARYVKPEHRDLTL